MKCPKSMQSRIKWSKQEDDKLRSLVKQQPRNAINWREIGEELQHYGYKRTFKACMDRYAQYLDEKIDHKILNASEINQLFDLVKSHGNQWGLIAQKFQNRSQLQVKNSFYSTVRKIYRRLVKSAYKDLCSKRISAIKCIYFSNMFCPNNISTRDQVYVDAEIKNKFQRLIFEKLNSEKNPILDAPTKFDVCYTLAYLEIKNLITLPNDNLETQKRQDEVLIQILNQKITLQQASLIIENLPSDKLNKLQEKLNQFFNLESTSMQVEEIELDNPNVQDAENHYNYSLGSQYDNQDNFFTQQSTESLIDIT